jgi:uncharacterized membrane protein YfcA
VTLGHVAALLLSSAGAGIMNALAGGGTIVTFPTLLLLGLPAITANATSTVALVPGAASSFWGYRREVAEHRDWLKTLFLPSLLGGSLGGVLLLMTPEKTFRTLAPFLVLFATLLFLFQAVRSRGRADAAGIVAVPLIPGRWAVAVAGQFAVAVYGGYFGAGIGIMMLVILGFLGLTDIHAMNGLKNFFGICINIVAAGYFIARGAVDWPAAIVMIVGATIGGFAGSHFARRIGKEKARAAVVVIGFVVTGILLLRM